MFQVWQTVGDAAGAAHKPTDTPARRDSSCKQGCCVAMPPRSASCRVMGYRVYLDALKGWNSEAEFHLILDVLNFFRLWIGTSLRHDILENTSLSGPGR